MLTGYFLYARCLDERLVYVQVHAVRKTGMLQTTLKWSSLEDDSVNTISIAAVSVA